MSDFEEVNRLLLQIDRRIEREVYEILKLKGIITRRKKRIAKLEEDKKTLLQAGLMNDIPG